MGKHLSFAVLEPVIFVFVGALHVCRGVFWDLKVKSYHLQKYVASYIFEQIENPRFFQRFETRFPRLSFSRFLGLLPSLLVFPIPGDHCAALSLDLILQRPYVSYSFLCSYSFPRSYSSLCSYYAFLHSYIPVLPY